MGWLLDAVDALFGKQERGRKNQRQTAALSQAEEKLRQSQKMEALGRLTGGIAHDFNNLLTLITSYSELLLKKVSPQDSIFEGLKEIHEAGGRAVALVRQLLVFSSRQILRPKVINLNRVVEGMGKMLGSLMGEGIVLKMALDPSLGAVRADPGQMEQVIMNISLNGRDAMPRGGKMTLETQNIELGEDYCQDHPEATPGRYVMLAATDTGSGMDKPTLEKIFEPFFTTKEQGKGTGLGLSTVYGIVRQSGGSIFVYSEVGRGTSFKIYLPRVDEVPEEIREVIAGGP